MGYNGSMPLEIDVYLILDDFNHFPKNNISVVGQITWILCSQIKHLQPVKVVYPTFFLLANQVARCTLKLLVVVCLWRCRWGVSLNNGTAGSVLWNITQRALSGTDSVACPYYCVQLSLQSNFFRYLFFILNYMSFQIASYLRVLSLSSFQTSFENSCQNSLLWFHCWFTIF